MYFHHIYPHFSPNLFQIYTPLSFLTVFSFFLFNNILSPEHATQILKSMRPST